MNEKSLSNLTLSSWAATVWEKELRGVPMQPQETALAWCMRQHGDWRSFWNGLNGPDVDTPRGKNILVHIYNDAAVKLQIASNNPPEINQLIQQMRGKGFSEMDGLHAIAFVLQEQNWNAKAGETFDLKQYVERAKRYVETVIEHPDLMRGLRTP